ncbi:hypothetical protein OJAV_G00009000 [Oryzias javanicus]|uniref:Uncharacterized protein n=1 Tax=Oryzias javanicus TaxID=123683 RepID=A0A3S2Q1S1_ORYJA|nr:hypothetical protein OJAV_G00009000 [Oryzias javanicus]
MKQQRVPARGAGENPAHTRVSACEGRERGSGAGSAFTSPHPAVQRLNAPRDPEFNPRAALGSPLARPGGVGHAGGSKRGVDKDLRVVVSGKHPKKDQPQVPAAMSGSRRPPEPPRPRNTT